MLNTIKKLNIKNFMVLSIAGFINAFGVTMFIIPVKLYDSGFSGTSILFAQISPEFLTLSFFLLVLNVPFFLYGAKKQGSVFTVYSIFAVCIYALSAWLITDILPFDVSTVSPIAGTDLLLCAIFGGILSGVGSGLTIRFGGALDGVEVMAVIFAKRIGLTVGTFVMVYNIILYLCAGFIVHSWILPLYSILTYAAGLKTVDFIVEGFDRAKSAMIVTNHPKEICQALSETFGSGVTLIEGKGYYSDSSKTVIYFVANRFQIGKMKSLVHEHDKNAFIAINDVADVFGVGSKK